MTFTILFLSEIYGLVTAGQVKDGKHLYRTLQAHFSFYLSLYKIYVGLIIDMHQAIEKEIKEVIVKSILDISEYLNEQEEKIKQNHENVRHLMKEINLSESQSQFDSSLSSQARFYRNYMDLFEVVLFFIRGSREQSWDFHLQSLNLLCRYCFAFDMLNYARRTLVYLAQMYELKEKDENI